MNISTLRQAQCNAMLNTRILLIISILQIGLANAQTTAIPDANFEQVLITHGYDTGTPDGVVLTANINTITFLNAFEKNISDLTGIEDFSALTNLNCGMNQLVSLDISQNTALTSLSCRDNQLTSLDISQNTALTVLYCFGNQLTNIDLSQNINLQTIYCFYNQFNTLDVSQNSMLSQLMCSNNNLTQLDVSLNSNLEYLKCDTNQLRCLNVANGNNLNFSEFGANTNPALTCIQVDDVSWSTTNWTIALGTIDPSASFSTNCTTSCSAGINEASKIPKELIKISDLMGREAVLEKNKVLIYMYSDGTIERVLSLE